MCAGSALTCASTCWQEMSRVPYLERVFTGIVEEMGTLVESGSVESGATDQGRRLVFSAATITEGTQIGDSISVNGCCLTVVSLGPGWWAADAVPETLGRTNLGDLRPGDPVNLERAAELGSRLGGHLVQGHVDAVGTVVAPAPALEIRLAPQLTSYLVEKGSVTVDGVSLTVVSVTGDRFSVAVIPHTLQVTTLGRKTAGDPVNVEVDVIAKYAARLLQAGLETPYRAVGVPGSATTARED
jgi:riboflavin synthase